MDFKNFGSGLLAFGKSAAIASPGILQNVAGTAQAYFGAATARANARGAVATAQASKLFPPTKEDSSIPWMPISIGVAVLGVAALALKKRR